MKTNERVKTIVFIALMVSILEAVKIALNSIPNVELVTLLIIIYTLRFGWKISLTTSIIFSFIECMYWGFSTWSIVYFYMWPLLILLTHIIKEKETNIPYILLSSFFGLFFGLFCSLVTFVIGGWRAAISWWIAGIPYDIIHGISNFIIAALLFKPINNALIILLKHHS